MAQLPALRLDDDAWQAIPPDPLDNPALYAGVRTRRVFGYLVDLMLIGVLWAAAWLVALMLGMVTLGLAWPLLVLVVGSFPLAYHTLTIAAGSATPGMWLFDVEVRSWTGKRPDFVQALVMTLIYMLTVWPTGLLILLGVGHGDTAETADRLAEKTATLRIFEDADGKTNLSVLDTAGSALVISQFTLYADTRRGRRPSFTDAAPPDLAESLVERFAKALESLGLPVQRGEFGARMEIALVNQGPMTVLLES